MYKRQSDDLPSDNEADVTGIANNDDVDNLVTYLIATSNSKASHDWTINNFCKICRTNSCC